MSQSYNKPAAGVPSTIGTQFNTQWYYKNALIEAQEEQYFTPLADSLTMPRNYGKKIVAYRYIPLLDDRNLNDQGIDATGVAIDNAKFYVVLPALVNSFTVEADATAAAAAINAIEPGLAVKAGVASPWTVTVAKRNLVGSTQVLATAVVAALRGASSRQGSGNLYGSSRDVGAIAGRLPTLTEDGGRVNRVGFKRQTLEGTFSNFGFFYDYSEDSIQFDTDEELETHVHREAVRGATQVTEDALQIDLLANAGVVIYTGSATSNATVDVAPVTYRQLMKLSLILDDNQTPRKTKVMTGTRMVDTKTIPSARFAFIGSALVPTLREMKDLHNNPAFIPVQQYAAGTTVLNGEIGMVDAIRFIQVPRMFKWEGAGAATADTSVYTTAGRVDVHPVLLVGDESFTTIGFQTSGKVAKFKVIHKKPGEEQANLQDPFGKKGFASIQWWYGFLAFRPERIALIKTAAKI